jgi:hypothetical protein
MFQLRQRNQYPILECDRHVVQVYEVRGNGVLPGGVTVMTQHKNGRTTSDCKYRPVFRKVSRYGKIEKALTDMREEGVEPFSVQQVAKRVDMISEGTARSILKFTRGIIKDPDVKNTYRFDPLVKEIMVESGGMTNASAV